LAMSLQPLSASDLLRNSTLTQAELAALLNCSQPTICLILKNQRPFSARMAARIAKAFNAAPVLDNSGQIRFVPETENQTKTQANG
jgi:plasmid maintenance system antidote protein VapI